MNKYVRYVSNPAHTTLHLLSRFCPTLFWLRYNRLGRKIGFKKLYFALSFDCDTPDDTKIVLDLDHRLRDMGVRPAYAVPGALLEEGDRIYSQLLQRGARFLNHGYQQHTFWNQSRNRYESCFFYNEISLEPMVEDVEKAHKALEKVLGLRPLGFRTPHFGTFQTRHGLTFLHSVLGEMGYKFSSSTMPFYAFRYGPSFKHFGLVEFPLTGAFSRPLLIQDSWNFYAAPGRQSSPDDFLNEARNLTRFCREKQMVGVLHYYADPSHVWNQVTFFDAVRTWRDIAEPVELGELSSL